MDITYMDFMIRKEAGQALPKSEVVFIADEPFNGWPDYLTIRRINEDEKQRTELIKMGLTSFSFLIPANTMFRLCYLGEKIIEHTTDKKARLVADILLLNGNCYSPLLKSHTCIKSI